MKPEESDNTEENVLLFPNAVVTDFETTLQIMVCLNKTNTMKLSITHKKWEM